MRRNLISITLFITLTLVSCTANKVDMTREAPLPVLTEPEFKNATVHDPSVIKVDGTYYIIGSHMAAAKTDDLMVWKQLSTAPRKGNVLVADPQAEFKEALEWSQTDTFWAGDLFQLKADGKYYMYYCTCRGDSPLACIGCAVSDDIEGPYKNLGIFLRSGVNGSTPDGNAYDATEQPNCIDPQVFYDKEGKLWMVYGSYSGGIFILELDVNTGLPKDSTTYGKKLLGGNHSRIEAPYIQYSPETDYYYLFLSFGGLDSRGGYNIRVCRSKNPDGPYEDYAGNDMLECKGALGSFFDDRAIEGYGVKLFGNFLWEKTESSAKGNFGYASPGHNSTYYDDENKQYFLFFHTRFPNRGEGHSVRVHQFFFNEDGWPVVAPFRYTGEAIGNYLPANVVGEYKFINHGKTITSEIIQSKSIVLNDDYTIGGDVSGKWEFTQDNICRITIEDVVYKGVFLWQWDESEGQPTMTFSVLSKDGVALWGSMKR